MQRVIMSCSSAFSSSRKYASRSLPFPVSFRTAWCVVQGLGVGAWDLRMGFFFEWTVTGGMDGRESAPNKVGALDRRVMMVQWRGGDAHIRNLDKLGLQLRVPVRLVRVINL